jgi:hypothetical protein
MNIDNGGRYDILFMVSHNIDTQKSFWAKLKDVMAISQFKYMEASAYQQNTLKRNKLIVMVLLWIKLLVTVTRDQKNRFENQPYTFCVKCEYDYDTNSDRASPIHLISEFIEIRNKPIPMGLEDNWTNQLTKPQVQNRYNHKWVSDCTCKTVLWTIPLHEIERVAINTSRSRQH